MRRKDYEALQKAGVAAILTFSGSTLDRRSETDCDIRKLRETLTEPFGDAVALNLRAADAAEMVRRGAKRLHLELEGESYDGVSQNVCAEIPGTDRPQEIISFGAHYDSVYFSSGVYDNLSGQRYPPGAAAVLRRASAPPDAEVQLVRLGGTGPAGQQGLDRRPCG